MKPRKFAIFSGLLKAYQGEDGVRRLKTTASSTIKDRVGDLMMLPAIQKMASSAEDNMTIFLNHRYNVPEDVLGSVEGTAIKQSGLDLYDLEFDVRVDDTNPRAVKTWESIQKGTKLGTSIGAIVNHWSENQDGGWDIDDVELLEASIVGIPANPRSWVQNAVKAIKGLEMDADDDDEEPKTEPAVDTDPQLLADVAVEITASTDPDVECEDDCTCEKHMAELLAQDAQLAPSIPETVEKETELEAPVTEPSETEAAGVLRSLELLAKTTGELVESKEELTKAVSSREKAVNERDEALSLLKLSFEMVQKIAASPVGRKTSTKYLVNQYQDKFGGMFDPDFLKMLENKTNE